MGVGVINRFDVCLADLEPTLGHEIKKIRPCLIISPDEMNRRVHTIIVAPMTTKGKLLPFRVKCTFKKKKGVILLDHMKGIDKKRLLKKLGTVSKNVQDNVLSVLAEIFAR